MDYFSHVSTFVEKVKRVSSMVELTELLDEVFKRYSCAYYALVSHVYAHNGLLGGLKIHNYPEHWVDERVAKGYSAIDPVLMLAQKSSIPFVWHDIEAYLKISPEQRQMLADAKAAGLINGYTVPIHDLNCDSGSCTFVCEHRVLDADKLSALYYIATFSFAAAKRISMR